MERTARLGAEGDIRFEGFTAAENISYFACRALGSER
jgi:hypothetical protein